ncbi:MAG: hypothetical protein WBQ08_08785 [Candidatus Sulfotelmatobacter sp.]
MSEKQANVQIAATGQLNGVGRQLFTAYGQHDQSPLLPWSPILLGLLASAIVALVFCPVPQSQTISGARALFLAIAYVMAAAGIGAFVLVGCGRVAGRRGLKMSRWLLPRFCCVAAWMTPVVAFYVRDSFWAASTALVLAAIGSGLIYRHHLAIAGHETPPASSEPQVTGFSQRTRFVSLTVAAFLLQFGTLFIVASMARPATIMIGSAVFVISFFHKTLTTPNQSQSQSRSQNSLRLSIAAGLAVVFVAASLTPYLAVSGQEGRSSNAGTSTRRSTAKRAGTSAKPKLGFLRSAGSFFRLLSDKPQPWAQDRPADDASRSGPYLTLQALFGEGETASESESSSLEKKSKNGKVTVIVAGDSYPGMILRPEVKDDVMIVPPRARRQVFDGKQNQRRADPVSIPFYGAYWFFRASDKSLPADALESRGDPASTSFKTTDFTPISMEARQNFGSLIDLSCCRAIELVISNGDRRPGTVAVELILSNTRLPGQPRQSLGILPVNSTLRWFPGDDRLPIAEVLSFRLPAQSAIQQFDQATIRFELRSPRERWSAKIAIEKFRLIPGGL